MHNTTEHFLQQCGSIPGDADYQKLQPLLPGRLAEYTPRSLKFSHGSIKWFQPVTLSSLLELKEQFPEARLVVGNTEVPNFLPI